MYYGGISYIRSYIAQLLLYFQFELNFYFNLVSGRYNVQIKK